MNRHAERIQRIQQICAELDAQLQTSQDLKKRAEALQQETHLLLQDLDQAPRAPFAGRRAVTS